MLTEHMNARFDSDFLAELMSIWPNPKTGEMGLTAYALAKGISVSPTTVHTWLEKNGLKQQSEPSLEQLRRLDRYFIIIEFKPDGSKRIDNAEVLKSIKAFLETHVYKKAIA